MSNLTVSIIQTNLHWEDKAANLQMLEKKINSIKVKTEIVVLPEMFSTGFSMRPEKLAETMEGETLQWMKRMAAGKKIILTGSVIIGQAASGGLTDYYNRLIWMQPNGEFGIYDKRHRFAYAGEVDHYRAGTKKLVASVKGWKLNLLICYDLRFPVWARQSPLSGRREPVPPGREAGIAFGNPPAAEIKRSEAEYDVLIYVANWPEKRNGAWKTLLQARAIENQCYVIGVNRVGNDGNNIYHSGDSMVIDPIGEILYHNKDEEDIFTITLDKTHLQNIREKFPFWRDADKFNLLNDKESM